jgi:hypothetical protein
VLEGGLISFKVRSAIPEVTLRRWGQIFLWLHNVVI